MSARFSSILTMADIYGPGFVFAPRAHSRTSHWISRDASLLDFMTGYHQTILGKMPSIASKGTVTPAGLELLQEAGLNPPPTMDGFQNEQHAIEMARAEIGRGSRIVIQHAYPTGLLPESALWVPPSLLAYLNNKAHLPHFAPPDVIPPRTVCSSAAIFRQFPRRPLPFVLKVATDLSTGAGAAVAVCLANQDLAAAAERFARCENLIVESFLPISQNLCLNHAVMPDGAIRYLGHAAQDVTPGGSYLGNWIDLGSKIPASLVQIAREIVQRAAEQGYRGIAGIDIAVLDDGRPLVLDLNFRVNGSTAAILLSPALLESLGPALVHLRTFSAPDGFKKMLAAARVAVRRGILAPLNTYDPIAAGHPSGPANLRGLVLGSSLPDVLAIERELASQGLH